MFGILYYGGVCGSDNSATFGCPRAAAAWALRRGLRDFTVVRISGPAGFYSAYRTFRGGAVSSDNRAARPGCGRGYGYGPGARRVA